MKKYRAAIIGCGRIGSEFDKVPGAKEPSTHAGAYYIHPRTELVAASDLDPVKLAAFERKWGVDSGYINYSDMLKRQKIDILSICTPPDSHFKIVQDAIRFPIKAIYCEKPIADNLEDAKKIVRVCKDRGIILIINHQRRFGKFYQELKEKLSKDFFGKVQQVNCYYTRGVMNTAIHIIDIFSFLFGEIKWVQAYPSQNKSPFKDDPNLNATIVYKNNLMVTIKACDDSHYLILEIDILTSKARLRLGNRLEYFEAIGAENLLGKKELRRRKDPPFKHKYGVISLVEGVGHIINCLEGREKVLSSGEDALPSLAAIEAMLSSARNGKRYYICHSIRRS